MAQMIACNNLGDLHKAGDGVKQDYQKANALYQKACDGGKVIACNNLGVSYATGKGLKQDNSQAKKLFGVACDGGNQNGCDNYRILNEQGVQDTNS